MKIYSADFETTTVNRENYKNQQEYREAVKSRQSQVYSWGIKEAFNKDAKFRYGLSIYDFIAYIETLEGENRIFFHNGSKFDFHFILPVLTQIYEFDTEYGTKMEDKKPYSITQLVNDSNKKVYGFQIKTLNGTVDFRDTALMYPNTIKGYGEILNKEFKTDKYTKLDLDSGYTREDEYNDIKELENDGNELTYLERDVDILKTFLEYVSEAKHPSKWAYTAAGDAYKTWEEMWIEKTPFDNYFEKRKISWKSWTGTHSWFPSKKDPSVGTLVRHKVKVPTKSKKPEDKGKMVAHRIFNLTQQQSMKYILQDNILSTRLFDGKTKESLILNKELRQYYKGGITQANGKYAFKEMKIGDVYKGISKIQELIYSDINSSFPSVMNSDRKFPIGDPISVDKIKKRRWNDYIWLYEITASTDIKVKEGLPFLAEKVNGSYQYNDVIKKGSVFNITDAELKRVDKYYTGYWKVEKKWGFNWVYGYNLWDNYINEFYDIKSNSTGAMKLHAKLQLNSLYGKYGSKLLREALELTKDGWGEKQWETGKAYYLPLAIWITAYARLKLVDSVGNHYDKVVYMDTDSLTIINDSNLSSEEYLKRDFNQIVDKDLGNWDIEYRLQSIITRRAKQYKMKTIEGKNVVKFAGLRLDQESIDKLSNDQFLGVGEIIEYVQKRPYRSPEGGIIIESFMKKIKNASQYSFNNQYENNEMFNIVEKALLEQQRVQ